MANTTLQHIKKDKVKIKHKKLLKKYRYSQKEIECNLTRSENYIGDIFFNSKVNKNKKCSSIYINDEKLWNI